MKITFEILDNEYWWGGTSSPAGEQCYGKHSNIRLDVQRLGNQSAPLYLSSQGRYVWADSPLVIEFNNGVITATGDGVECVKAGETLRDAYLGAMRRHFPFEKK